MKHQPKYTALTQRLINACQAAAGQPGLHVVVELQLANLIAKHPPHCLALFDFRDRGDKTFTVTLRDEEPQPQPPTP